MSTKIFAVVAVFSALFVGCDSGDDAAEAPLLETPATAAQAPPAAETEAAGDEGVADYLIDGDGTDSPFVLSSTGEGIEGGVGDQLTAFADECPYALGVMDNDKSGDWSEGDDLITEGQLGGHWGRPIRSGGDDDVLDLDGSLAKGARAPEADFFEAADLAHMKLAYIATNDNGCWEPGEDIIWDVNGDGRLDSYQSWGG